MALTIYAALAGFILGIIFGGVCALKFERRRDRTPVPVPTPGLSGTGLHGPQNARRGEPVEICGATWWRM